MKEPCVYTLGIRQLNCKRCEVIYKRRFRENLPAAFGYQRYMINQQNGEIAGWFTSITTAMQVDTFLGNITKGHSAQTLKVFTAGKSTVGKNAPKLMTDTLTNNDVLEVTAENGDVKQYTITVTTVAP